MPPSILADYGDSLLIQGDDGSSHEVAKNLLSPDYLAELQGGSPQAGPTPEPVPAPVTAPTQEATPSAAPVQPEPQPTPDQVTGVSAPSAELPPSPVAAPAPVAKTPEATTSEPPPSSPGSSIDRLPSYQADQTSIDKLPQYKGPETAPEKVQKGFDLQKQAAEEGAQIGMAKANALSSFQQQYAANLEKSNQIEKAKFDDQQSFLKDQVQKYDNLSEDFRKNSKVRDPWADASTGYKIGAAISIALGALGGSLDGSHTNKALDIINQAIDRDIQIQKANIENKKTGIDLQRNVVAMTRDRFSDKNQADAALHNLYLDQVKAQMMAIGSKYDAPQIKANLKDAIGKIEVAQQGYQQSFLSSALDNQTKYMNLTNPTRTPEQARNLEAANKLESSATKLGQLQNAPSRLGAVFKTQASGLVDELNRETYSGLYPDKEPAGKAYEDWASSAGLTRSDVGKPDVINAKIESLREKAKYLRMGAGRGAAPTGQK